MINMRVAVLLAGLLIGATTIAAAQTAPWRIVTGSERGTYIQVARDLSQHVAGPARIKLEALPSKGSTENVQRLRFEPGVRLALVQSDVYQAFLDQAHAGNADAMRLIKPLKVVLPLYDEEVYFVTRADSPLTFVHEIKDKKINIGPIGSGTALTATTVYRLMFGAAIDENNATFLSNEEALLKLATDKSIDVAIIVAGQPAKLFSELKPESRQYIKLLRLEERAPETQAALAAYFPATVRASSYPNWLEADVRTLTTKAFLVTYDFRSSASQEQLTKFARSLCQNFASLRSEGHAKWKEVELSLPPLGKGWSYYEPTERELRSCRPSGTEAAAVASAGARLPSCPQEKVVLGLCRP
jgi:uncharacterized protein